MDKDLVGLHDTLSNCSVTIMQPGWLSFFEISTLISNWEKQDSDSNTKGSPTDTYLNQRNANSYKLQTLHPWTLFTEANNIAKITGQVSSHITQWFKPLVCIMNIFSSRWEIWVQ